MAQHRQQCLAGGFALGMRQAAHAREQDCADVTQMTVIEACDAHLRRNGDVPAPQAAYQKEGQLVILAHAGSCPGRKVTEEAVGSTAAVVAPQLCKHSAAGTWRS